MGYGAAGVLLLGACDADPGSPSDPWTPPAGGDDSDDDGDEDAPRPDLGGDTGAEPVFDPAIRELLDRECVEACHEPGGQWFALDLSGERTYETLVATQAAGAAMTLVAPGQPEASYLWLKLNGTHLDHGGSGAQMPIDPRSGEAMSLDPEDLVLVQRWIEGGAMQ